jgi:hypothetical protein
MAKKRETAETAETTPHLPKLLSGSCGKVECESAIANTVNYLLERESAATTYIRLKQLEYAVSAALSNLKEDAFNSVGESLGGLASGELDGHVVSISYPKVTTYSPAVAALKEQQAKTLKALQAVEIAEGLATVELGKGVLTVKLRD